MDEPNNNNSNLPKTEEQNTGSSNWLKFDDTTKSLIVLAVIVYAIYMFFWGSTSAQIENALEKALDKRVEAFERIGQDIDYDIDDIEIFKNGTARAKVKWEINGRETTGTFRLTKINGKWYVD